MRLASNWTYRGGDPCASFFGACLRAADPDVRPDARVLEIGCCEFDWMTLAHDAWPQMSIVGIDWRHRKRVPDGTTAIKGDVMVQTFAPGSFDWIVGVSSIEHIGLGHYEADPTCADGDVRTWDLCWQWLAPGGWLYFDVPWNSFYQVVNSSHRIYDDAAIETRAKQGKPWREHWRGFAHRGSPSTLVTPTPTKGGESFHYIGLWWQKPEIA